MNLALYIFSMFEPYLVLWTRTRCIWAKPYVYEPYPVHLSHTLYICAISYAFEPDAMCLNHTLCIWAVLCLSHTLCVWAVPHVHKPKPMHSNRTLCIWILPCVFEPDLVYLSRILCIWASPHVYSYTLWIGHTLCIWGDISGARRAAVSLSLSPPSPGTITCSPWGRSRFLEDAEPCHVLLFFLFCFVLLLDKRIWRFSVRGGFGLWLLPSSPPPKLCYYTNK